MITVVESVQIDHPADGVFAFIAEPSNRARWDATVISEELTSAPPIGVGSTLRSQLSALGREVEFHWRVTAFEPPRTMAFVSTEGPMETSLLLELAASGSLTLLTATIEAAPSGMMRLFEPVIGEGVRNNLATGLERMKALLESGG